MSPSLHAPQSPSYMIGCTHTLSPTFHLPETPSPSPSITPLNSCPKVRGTDSPVMGCGVVGHIEGPPTPRSLGSEPGMIDVYAGEPIYSCKSLPQIPHQAGRILICPFPHCGSAMSSRRRSSLPWNRTAFIFSPSVGADWFMTLWSPSCVVADMVPRV